MSPRVWEEIKSFFTTLIGNTADNDGSSTAGTLMAKVNAVLLKLNTDGAVNVKVVKRIQRGVITINDGERSGKATISYVDINKSIVLFGGYRSSGTTDSNQTACQLALTNATTVTAIRISSSALSYVPYQVVEFY